MSLYYSLNVTFLRILKPHPGQKIGRIGSCLHLQHFPSLKRPHAVQWYCASTGYEHLLNKSQIKKWSMIVEVSWKEGACIFPTTIQTQWWFFMVRKWTIKFKLSGPEKWSVFEPFLNLSGCGMWMFLSNSAPQRLILAAKNTQLILFNCQSCRSWYPLAQALVYDEDMMMSVMIK